MLSEIGFLSAVIDAPAFRFQSACDISNGICQTLSQLPSTLCALVNWLNGSSSSPERLYSSDTVSDRRLYSAVADQAMHAPAIIKITALFAMLPAALAETKIANTNMIARTTSKILCKRHLDLFALNV